jgi:hypothetical protein
MKMQAIPALAACVTLVALGTPPASAAPVNQATASVRGAHFSPDTPSVDVYLTAFSGGTSKLALSNVGYGDVSDYQTIPAGLYTVGMRPAGADPSTPVAISWTLDAKPGEAFTAMAIGMHDALQGRVLTDDLTAAPPDQARVRVIQAASKAPKVDVKADNGPVVGTAVPFGTSTDYENVSAGKWPLTAQASDNSAMKATTSGTFAPGTINTVVLLDTKQNGLAMRVLPDGVPESPVPGGPVEAGGGSTARVAADHELVIPGLVLTGLALTATLALLGRTLRRSSSATS